MPIFQLTKDLILPAPELAEEDGILAVGGDLRPERLLLAYRNGIFPWPCEDLPLAWWSPDPRCVLFPDRLKVSKSLARVIRSDKFTVTFDRDFRAVIENCRTVRRRDDDDTWITPDMVEAYCRLHALGHAHSVETWQDGELVGGLYGVSVGRCFSGESMFSKVSNASKVAFAALVEQRRASGCALIDCQIHNDHLASLGAEEIPREQFLRLLRDGLRDGP